MFDFNVLWTRQVILAIGVGLVLALSFFLSYLPMKRVRDPRRYQSEESPGPFTRREVWSYMPWMLVLVYVGTLVYSIIDMVWKSAHPPNY